MIGSSSTSMCWKIRLWFSPKLCKTASILFPHVEKRSGGVSFGCSLAALHLSIYLTPVWWHYYHMKSTTNATLLVHSVHFIWISFPSCIFLFSSLRRTSITEDTKSSGLPECSLLLSNPSPRVPHLWILLTSPITPDAGGLFIHQNGICIWKPLGEHHHHSRNTHNRGLLQIFPQVWQCIYSAGRLGEQMAE